MLLEEGPTVTPTFEADELTPLSVTFRELELLDAELATELADMLDEALAEEALELAEEDPEQPTTPTSDKTKPAAMAAMTKLALELPETVSCIPRFMPYSLSSPLNAVRKAINGRFLPLPNGYAVVGTCAYNTISRCLDNLHRRMFYTRYIARQVHRALVIVL